jgi:hypothetical protein
MIFRDVTFKERIAPWWGARSSKPEGGVKRPWWVRFLPFSAIFEGLPFPKYSKSIENLGFVARVAESHDRNPADILLSVGAG